MTRVPSAVLLCVLYVSHRYAKVSKRVNIQRLKTDIWGNIRSALPAADQDHDGHDTENHQPSAVPRPDKLSGVSTGDREALSFQSMISDLAAGDEVRQRDVSLPFYFICLLHLANEHVSTVPVLVVALKKWLHCSEKLAMFLHLVTISLCVAITELEDRGQRGHE
jgi:hypothetical protein